MIRKYSVLICLTIAVLLIGIAALLYPGGSLHDPNSRGFDWTKNFISNLFGKTALNGEINKGRVWAIIGMAFHSIGNGLFFIHMSRKFTNRHVAIVLMTAGLADMLFSFLIVTPLHDIMVTLSATFSLLGLFYITIFMLKTRLHLLKVCCILAMLIFYFTLYLYGAGDWGLLAIMQKVTFVTSMLLILSLEYFTKRQDFITKGTMVEEVDKLNS